MKFKAVAAGIAMALGASAGMAAPGCNSTTNWASVGAPGLELFGSSFSSTTKGTHHDCYTFSVGSATSLSGNLLEFDPLLNKLNIDVTKVSLFRNNALVGADSDAQTFSFASLLGGAVYTLMFDSIVTKGAGIWDKNVGYGGMITTVAAPVPEPALVALVIAGLVGVGAATARRKKG